MVRRYAISDSLIFVRFGPCWNSVLVSYILRETTFYVSTIKDKIKKSLLETFKFRASLFLEVRGALLRYGGVPLQDCRTPIESSL